MSWFMLLSEGKELQGSGSALGSFKGLGGYCGRALCVASQRFWACGLRVCGAGAKLMRSPRGCRVNVGALVL